MKVKLLRTSVFLILLCCTNNAIAAPPKVDDSPQPSTPLIRPDKSSAAKKCYEERCRGCGDTCWEKFWGCFFGMQSGSELAEDPGCCGGCCERSYED